MMRTLDKLLHESSQIRRHRFFLCSNNLSSHCLWIISLIKWKNLQIIYFYLYFPIHEACRWFQIIWMLHVVWVTQLAQNFIFFFWSHVDRCTSVFHSTPISTVTIHMHSGWWWNVFKDMTYQCISIYWFQKPESPTAICKLDRSG